MNSTTTSTPDFKSLLLTLVKVINYTFSQEDMEHIISNLPPEFTSLDMKLILHFSNRYQDNCNCMAGATEDTMTIRQPCDPCRFIDSTIFDLEYPNAKEIHKN